MDDEPMWAADRVVAPTPGSAITIPKTANEFAIKGNHLTLIKGNQFDDRIETDPLKYIHEFLGICDMFKYRDTENEAVRLMMFPLSLTGEAKTWLDELNEGTIKTNTDTDKIIARMDAMTIKIDARYKELQSHAKQPTPDLDDDDMPMSREEEAKFMQTFPENMLVEVGKFTFPADFVILEMEEESKVPLILGRPFLHTADAVIRVNRNNSILDIDVIDEILEEDFDALLDKGSKILHSIKGTLLEEEIFSEFDEFMAITADENSESKFDTEEPPF
ncbi:reverse transcriptase domain-containing protein [Tanacetum coccineum]